MNRLRPVMFLTTLSLQLVGMHSVAQPPQSAQVVFPLDLSARCSLWDAIDTTEISISVDGLTPGTKYSSIFRESLKLAPIQKVSSPEMEWRMKFHTSLREVSEDDSFSFKASAKGGWGSVSARLNRKRTALVNDNEFTASIYGRLRTGLQKVILPANSQELLTDEVQAMLKEAKQAVESKDDRTLTKLRRDFKSLYGNGFISSVELGGVLQPTVSESIHNSSSFASESESFRVKANALFSSIRASASGNSEEKKKIEKTDLRLSGRVYGGDTTHITIPLDKTQIAALVTDTAWRSTVADRESVLQAIFTPYSSVIPDIGLLAAPPEQFNDVAIADRIKIIESSPAGDGYAAIIKYRDLIGPDRFGLVPLPAVMGNVTTTPDVNNIRMAALSFTPAKYDHDATTHNLVKTLIGQANVGYIEDAQIFFQIAYQPDSVEGTFVKNEQQPDLIPYQLEESYVLASTLRNQHNRSISPQLPWIASFVFPTTVTDRLSDAQTLFRKLTEQGRTSIRTIARLPGDFDVALAEYSLNVDAAGTVTCNSKNIASNTEYAIIQLIEDLRKRVTSLESSMKLQESEGIIKSVLFAAKGKWTTIYTADHDCYINVETAGTIRISDSNDYAPLAAKKKRDIDVPPNGDATVPSWLNDRIVQKDGFNPGCILFRIAGSSLYHSSTLEHKLVRKGEILEANVNDTHPENNSGQFTLYTEIFNKVK